MPHPNGPVNPHHLPDNHIDDDLIKKAEDIGLGYGNLVTPSGEIDSSKYVPPVQESEEILAESPENDFFLPPSKLMADTEGQLKNYYELVDQVNLALTRLKSQGYTEEEALNIDEVKSALEEIEKIRRSFYGCMAALKEKGLEDTFNKVKNLRPTEYRNI